VDAWCEEGNFYNHEENLKQSLMKKIEFLPTSEDAKLLTSPPSPSRNHQPQWLKSMPFFDGGKMEISLSGMANLTPKSCVPFLDAYNFGYIQETWCDVYINSNESKFETYHYSSVPPIMEIRQKKSIPISEDFYQVEFVWKSIWAPRVPKGYSVLYTHPLNRDDLPFYSLSGVVDADKYTVEADGEGNHPFLIRKGFNGLIPKGTPMFQIIPFKRDDWQSSSEEFDYGHMRGSAKLRQKFWGFYKSNYWTKKTFK
jgi:hypothetical protein